MKENQETALVKTDDPQTEGTMLVQVPEANIQTIEMFGSIRTFHQLANAFSAQFFRGLQLFQRREGYKSYGYRSMDEFLDKHENSPIKKTAYYEKLVLLEKEGDASFDLLNELRISKETRKLLGEGAVQIEGDAVIVGETRAELSNLAAVKELIKSFAAENSKQLQANKELEAKNQKLADKLDAFQASVKPETPEDSYLAALTKYYLTLKDLTKEAQNLTLVEAARHADGHLSLIREGLAALKHAYRRPEFSFDADDSDAPQETAAPKAVEPEPDDTNDIAAFAARAAKTVLHDDNDDELANMM